jgi:cellulose biosynthesis protein BcsQ
VRFRLTALAVEVQDLRSKMRAHPEILLLDASIFPGPGPLVDFLSGVRAAVYVLLPPQARPQEVESIERLEAVRGVFSGELNLIEQSGRMYADALVLRRKRAGVLDGVWERGVGERGVPTTLRIATIWSQIGGVGKTTIASNLAYEAARRGFPTLLIGLGAPDDLPLILGLKPTPNITTWWNNPTTDGLRLSIQKVDTLDVVAGFPDVLSEAQALATPAEAANSIPKLIQTAAHYAGYAVLVVDTPPTSLAAGAISVSNTLVLVSRPSLEGVMRTVEAYRTISERLSGEHRIPESAILVLLNRVGDRLSADEWHRAASAMLGRSFPPLIAQIPEDPQVGYAQDRRRMPLMSSDTFARALKPLADHLLHLPQARPITPPKKTINLGILKVKL